MFLFKKKESVPSIPIRELIKCSAIMQHHIERWLELEDRLRDSNSDINLYLPYQISLLDLTLLPELVNDKIIQSMFKTTRFSRLLSLVIEIEYSLPREYITFIKMNIKESLYEIGRSIGIPRTNKDLEEFWSNYSFIWIFFIIQGYLRERGIVKDGYAS